MRKKLFLAVFLLLTFISLSYAKSSFAIACIAGTGTTNASCGNTPCKAYSCNGNTCQTQGYYCSGPNGSCVCGWKGGTIDATKQACTGMSCGPTTSGNGTCLNTPNQICSSSCTGANQVPGSGTCLTNGQPNGEVCCLVESGGGGNNPPPNNTNEGCPVCPTSYNWDPIKKQCTQLQYHDSTGTTSTSIATPTYATCSSTQVCYQGCGCDKPCNQNAQFRSGSLPCGTSGQSCPTAIGDINASGVGGLVTSLFRIILALGGGIAVILIIFSGYRLMMSQGNPESVQNARNQLAAAIVGLLFIIFSLVILQTIGVDIIKLPGFGK